MSAIKNAYANLNTTIAALEVAKQNKNFAAIPFLEQKLQKAREAVEEAKTSSPTRDESVSFGFTPFTSIVGWLKTTNSPLLPLTRFDAGIATSYDLLSIRVDDESFV
jgi:hypothetical protein